MRNRILLNKYIYIYIYIYICDAVLFHILIRNQEKAYISIFVMKYIQ
jgi:hypothetical protein